MANKKRPDLKKILADPDLRRKPMVSTIQATQAREGIETSEELASQAYYVVTEGEKAAFFDLQRFRGGRGEPDRRHEMFVRTVRADLEDVRFDVPLQSFSFLEGHPLAYTRIPVISQLSRSTEQLGNIAAVQHGLSTKDDARFVRLRWEIPSNLIATEMTELYSKKWALFSKGGEYSTFYADIYLVVDAQDDFKRIKLSLDEKYPYLKGNYGWILHPENNYFQEGLTYSRRSQKGFSVRYLTSQCFFSDKGPTIFTAPNDDIWSLLGILNSSVCRYVLGALTSFGSYEVGAVKKIPVPARGLLNRLRDYAKTLHDAKSTWDQGNEISARFSKPWVLHEDILQIDIPLSRRLDQLLHFEFREDIHLQKLYREMDNEIFRLYGISGDTKKIIEQTFGKLPIEVIWPQMEGKSQEQKRMEHVWRLLSYAVKRVLESDEDGIVPTITLSGEPSILDRVYKELENLFPGQSISQVEIDIVNELKRKVKGYRSTNSIQQWLEDVFFEYHVSLYKNRPIFWHIASAQGRNPAAFGALVHYHKFDKNRVAMLRGNYLRDAVEFFRREAALASQQRKEPDRLDWQAKLEEAQDPDGRLQLVQEGHHEGPDGGSDDLRILTPWKSPEDRPKGWDPDLDDGVKVNIEPLQKAGVLRISKVV